ncbi:MAG: hypothetical protein ABSH12_07370 [Endomicrobiales bacterium]|jgi:hypothetical protein
MSEETQSIKSKCPICHEGQLGIRLLVKDGLPDLYCANTQCNKLFRAFWKDVKNNCYRIYRIDQYGITSGKDFEIAI